MKKYSWIAALVIALTLVMVLVGCDDGDDNKTKKTPPPQPPLVFVGEEIAIKAVGEGKSTAEKNTFEVADEVASSVGFAYYFPDDLAIGYTTIEVEIELLSETAAIVPDFISFNAKDGTDLKGDVLIAGHTQQYHGELKIGTITDKELSAACDGDVCLQYAPGTCIKGAKGSAVYPMAKLVNKVIVFQYNPYAGDITTTGWTSSGKATFKIAVTKITFLSAAYVEPEPPPPPPPPGAEDEEKFAAVTGLTGIFINEWNAGSCKMSGDNTTGIISNTDANGSGSSLISLTVPSSVTITGTVDIKIAVAILAAGQVKLTAKKPGSGDDLSPATYIDVTSSTESGFLEKTISIPAARYQDSSGSFAAPAKLSFQENGGGDWQMKIVSITVE